MSRVVIHSIRPGKCALNRESNRQSDDDKHTEFLRFHFCPLLMMWNLLNPFSTSCRSTGSSFDSAIDKVISRKENLCKKLTHSCGSTIKPKTLQSSTRRFFKTRKSRRSPITPK